MSSAATAQWWHWAAVAYAAVGVSLIGHGGTYYLLRRYPVSIVNPGFTLAPVFGVLGGIYLLDERLSFRVVLGAAVTLLGVLIVALREAKVAEAHGVLPEEAELKTVSGKAVSG
jgi:O-acetylserine/cysteine efflux transporter